MQRSDALWLTAFGLGFIFTFMVALIPVGMGMFLFMNGLIAALWYYGKKNTQNTELNSTKISNALVAIFTGFYVLLTFTYLYRLDTPILVSVILTQLVLLFFGAMYYALPAALHVVDLFSIIISPLALGLTWLVESFKAFFDLFKENSNIVKLVLKVILYAALSLFVFIIFARLLAQADAEFKKRIDYILDSLRLAEVMGRMVWGVVVSFIVAGLLTIVGTMKVLPLFGFTTERVKQQWDKAFSVIFSKRSDAILPVIVTIPILMLFALYVWVQFTYLFGHDMSAVLAKYSFAEYAHRGFAELLIVAILTYPLLSWSMNQSKSEWKVPRYATFAVNTGIVGMLVVMLYSLIVRMNIYLQTYGPSVLRLYVMVGCVFVALVLVAYEIFAVAKAAKPGYTLVNGRFFGDYTVIGIIALLGLISTLSLIPWNSVVLSQIEAYYKKSGNVDVFQLVQLSDEVQPRVYTFGKKLESDGLKEGSLLVQAHAIRAKDSYMRSRETSIFTKLFGFNFAAQQFYAMPKTSVVQINTDLQNVLNSKLTSMTEQFVTGLTNSDFATARKIYDPQMVANDIKGFTPGVMVKESISQSYLPSERSYYIEGLISGSQKTINTNVALDIYRNSLYQPYISVNPDLIATLTPTPTVSAVTPIKPKPAAVTNLDLTFSFRNGKLVATHSSLVLSYLPDAVNENNGTNSYGGLSDYGYHTYCKVPTLDYLFNGSACAEVTTAQKSFPVDGVMNGFRKTDFVTQTVNRE